MMGKNSREKCGKKMLNCFYCCMLKWICEKNVLKFVCNTMIMRDFLIILKNVKCMFADLSLSLKTFK